MATSLTTDELHRMIHGAEMQNPGTPFNVCVVSDDNDNLAVYRVKSVWIDKETQTMSFVFDANERVK